MKLLVLLILSVGLAPAAPASSSWENLNQLKPGDPVEIVTSDRVAKGEFVSSSTESLSIHTNGGEQKFMRAEIVRVVSRSHARRGRNVLIGVAAGVGIGLIADLSLGTYLRNESNPDGARALIWTVPIAAGAGIGAAFPSYPVIYQK